MNTNCHQAEHIMQKRGFTLIELSIVIVIIGLLIGGVMAGRTMMEAARINSSVAQIAEYDAAIATFRDKYGCYPGDSPNLTYLAHPALPSNRPNCDGKIRDRNGADTAFEGDTNNVWSQLSVSGIIKQEFSNRTAFFDGGSWKTGIPEFKLVENQGIAVATSTNTPEVSVNGNPLVFSGEVTVYFISDRGSASYGFGGGNPLYDSSVTIRPSMAYAFDAKMDDGLPTTGRVRATNGWDPVGKPNDNSCPSCGGCVVQGSNLYWVTSTTISNYDCGLAISLVRQ